MKRGPCHRPAKKPCWSSSLAGEIAIGHSADSWSYLLLNKGRLRHWRSRAGWGEGVMCALMLLVPYHPLHLQTHSKEPRNEQSMESWDFIGTRKKQTQESWDRFKHNIDCWHNLPFSYFGPTHPSWHPPTKQHCVTSTGLQTQAESQVSANDKPTATFPDTGSHPRGYWVEPARGSLDDTLGLPWKQEMLPHSPLVSHIENRTIHLKAKN